MTVVTENDRRAICRIQLTAEGRWVSLALSLAEGAAPARFLTNVEPLLFEMKGIDAMARTYGLATWQGGIISGARYAFRALKTPIRQVCVHELRGQLGSGDVGAIGSAASAAVAHLLGLRAELPLDFAGWQMEEEITAVPSADALKPATTAS